MLCYVMLCYDIVDCRLLGAEPLSEQVLACCQLEPKNNIQWTFNRKSNIFIRENAFQNNVTNLAAILPRPQRVNFDPARLLA